MSAHEKMTGEEMFESLTGFEEIAIAKYFGQEISDLAESKPTMFLRSLVFTMKTREGKEAKHAKTEAMGMTLKECNGYFEADDEIDEDQPVTEPGKDGSPTD